MAKVRLKKRNCTIAVGCLVVFIVAVIGITKSINNWKKEQNYKKTYEYKLQEHGYSLDDTNYLIKSLKDDDLEELLNRNCDSNIVIFMKEKYYLKKNLESYLSYYQENPDKSATDIVAIINVGANKDWYENYKSTDLDKDYLMLTNKFNQLSKDYEPEDLENVKNWYAYGTDPKLRKIAYENFISMYNAAKKDGQDLVINSPYRSYKYQENLYNSYLSSMGEKATDEVAARPGFSEHQTGLSVDIMTYGANADNFETFEEFTWLSNHAHEYGFILRYPKDKKYLTGYNYESWHYRYVGVEVATYIHEHNITFDEYYAYFIEGEEV